MESASFDHKCAEAKRKQDLFLAVEKDVGECLPDPGLMSLPFRNEAEMICDTLRHIISSTAHRADGHFDHFCER